MADDPLLRVRDWIAEATSAGVPEPDAAALSTASPDGRPSVRFVLVRGVDERGLRFFTNYGSRKGGELEANPHAALVFHWPEVGRQVRIEGSVSRVDRSETEAYARTRERASQLSALASPQSRPIPDRAWLERRVEDLDREHSGGELPVSDDWGGYRLEPRAWEFWEHRPNRLHDRLSYERKDGAWRAERLGP